MAKLESEDQQYRSFIDLIPGEVRTAAGTEKWQPFAVFMKNGRRAVMFGITTFEKESGPIEFEERAHPSSVGSERIRLADGTFLERHPKDSGAQGCFLLCRAPKDEVAQLVALLKRLAERRLNHVRFETLEPSIELEITRQSSEEEGSLIEGTVATIEAASADVADDGLKVQLFVDAGNVETEISRWDALGIRFFTNQSQLELFIEALQKDFGC